MEKIKESEIHKKPIDFSSEIYRFKIIPDSLDKQDDKKYQILVTAEADDGNKT